MLKPDRMRVAGSESREIPPDDGARDSRYSNVMHSCFPCNFIKIRRIAATVLHNSSTTYIRNPQHRFTRASPVVHSDRRNSMHGAQIIQHLPISPILSRASRLENYAMDIQFLQLNEKTFQTLPSPPLRVTSTL